MVSLEKRIIIFYLYLYLYLLIIIFIIYSIVLRCLLATLGFDWKLGLETANFVFTIAKIASFSIAAKKNVPKNADTE